MKLRICFLLFCREHLADYSKIVIDAKAPMLYIDAIEYGNTKKNTSYE